MPKLENCFPNSYRKQTRYGPDHPTMIVKVGDHMEKRFVEYHDVQKQRDVPETFEGEDVMWLIGDATPLIIVRGL